MWLLENHTPYVAERSWTRDHHGVHWYLVAIRGTFLVDPDGRLSLADEQAPPVLAPLYAADAGVSSLLFDSDLLETKPGTDVLVLGRAFAPRGRPAPAVPVVLRVGVLEKQLVVYGNRVYVDGAMGLGTTSAQPFVEQPIDYERAFGGGDVADPDPQRHRIDERNPIGRGFPPKASVWANELAHCVEYPDGSHRRGPAGFGPIDRHWLPRRTLAGTYDAAWVGRKKPLLPDDYDPRFGHCAPIDQQLPQPLGGGERVGVLNMSPEGSLVFELPRVSFRMRTRIGSTRHDHGATLSTITIEPAERRVSVVWRSSLRVPARQVDDLRTTDIREEGRGR
ncbi:MAG: DUF2169 domain-containing protein [Myxococcales bacterium]|nr:DUF2169 domain-containing protein [Myxococcales bacterium]